MKKIVGNMDKLNLMLVVLAVTTILWMFLRSDYQEFYRSIQNMIFSSIGSVVIFRYLKEKENAK